MGMGRLSINMDILSVYDIANNPPNDWTLANCQGNTSRRQFFNKLYGAKMHKRNFQARKTMKNAIFITCFNCEKQLPRLCEKILKVDKGLQSNGWLDIYIIDNQSRDNTFKQASNCQEKLEAHGFNVHKVRNKQNHGLGGSHKVAFTITKKEGFNFCCILHGDDQADPKDLAELGGLFCQYDAMLGSRFSRRSRLDGYSKLRIAGNLIINSLYTIVIGKWVKDLGSGLNIISNKIASDSEINNFTDGMYFNTSLLMLIMEKYSYKFFPIVWREADQTSNARNLEIAANIVKNLLSTRFLRSSYGEKRYQSIDKYQYEVL